MYVRLCMICITQHVCFLNVLFWYMTVMMCIDFGWVPHSNMLSCAIACSCVITAPRLWCSRCCSQYYLVWFKSHKSVSSKQCSLSEQVFCRLGPIIITKVMKSCTHCNTAQQQGSRRNGLVPCCQMPRYNRARGIEGEQFYKVNMIGEFEEMWTFSKKWKKIGNPDFRQRK